VSVFDSLEHYYAAEMNVTIYYLSEVIISKSEFIALYDKARVLEFVVKNVINA